MAGASISTFPPLIASFANPPKSTCTSSPRKKTESALRRIRTSLDLSFLRDTSIPELEPSEGGVFLCLIARAFCHQPIHFLHRRHRRLCTSPRHRHRGGGRSELR